jgi:hypothetical protein
VPDTEAKEISASYTVTEPTPDSTKGIAGMLESIVNPLPLLLPPHLPPTVMFSFIYCVSKISTDALYICVHINKYSRAPGCGKQGGCAKTNTRFLDGKNSRNVRR